MTRIVSRIDAGGADFRENAAQMESLVAELRRRLAQAAAGGGEEARARHLARGKLLPRDRIEALLDPGSPFLEIAPLAAGGMYGDDAPAAGLVAGIGRIHGNQLLVVANDATVKGGTYYPVTVKKHLRAQEIACRILRSCRRLGVHAIAVYSEADRGALHVRSADESVCIGPAPARVSYLNAGAIIEAARSTRADAIHPGYGFLSENAQLRRRPWSEAGVTFMGAPDARQRSPLMARQDAAWQLMAEAHGVAVSAAGCMGANRGPR